MDRKIEVEERNFYIVAKTIDESEGPG